MHTTSYKYLTKPEVMSQDPLFLGGVWAQDYLALSTLSCALSKHHVTCTLCSKLLCSVRLFAGEDELS